MKLENSVRDIKADGCNDVILFDMMLHLMEKNYNLLIKDDELIDLEFVKSVHPETEEESKEYISAFNRSRCNQPDVEKLVRELANANQESVVRNNDFDAAICDSLTASLGVKGCTADVVDKDFVLREFFKSSDFSSVEDQATRNPKDWVIWPESVVESVEAADGIETDKIPVENCQPQKAQISVVEEIGQYLNETQDTEPTAASSQVETLAQGSHVMLTVDQVQRAPNATSNSNSSHNASLTECMASQNIAQITNISTLTNVGSNSQVRYPSSSDQSRVTQDISILERVPCFIETENNGSDFQIADVKMEEVEHQECPTPNFSEIIDIKTDPDFSTYNYEWSQNSNPSCWNQSVNGAINCPVKIEQVGSEGPVNQPSENGLGVVNEEIVEADDSKSLLTNFYQALSHSDYCSDENVETDTDGNNGGEATTTRSTRSTRSSVGSMDSDLYSPSLSDLDDFQDSLNDHQVFGSPLAPSEWLLDDSESSNLDSPIFPLPPMIPGTRQFDDGPAKTAVQLKFTFDQIIDPSIGMCSSSESQELFERDEISSQLLSTDSPSQFEHTDGAVLKIEDPQQETLECKWAWCGVECTGQEGLVRHIETCHVEPKKADQFTCLWDSCMRQARPFNARYKLLIHMRVHSGEKPNKCPFIGCPKAFSRLENLKIHQRSHTGERPYKCQYDGCLKAFSNSSDRAKHQRTHLDTKPYACQIDGCSKKYTDPSSLRKHIKNHTTPHSSVKTKKAATANGSHSNSRKSHSRKMTNEIHEQTGTISEGKYKTGGKEMDFDEVDSTAEFVPYDYSPVYFNDFDRKFNHYEENEETLTKSFIPFLTHGDSLFLS